MKLTAQKLKRRKLNSHKHQQVELGRKIRKYQKRGDEVLLFEQQNKNKKLHCLKFQSVNY